MRWTAARSPSYAHPRTGEPLHRSDIADILVIRRALQIACQALRCHNQGGEAQFLSIHKHPRAN